MINVVADVLVTAGTIRLGVGLGGVKRPAGVS
jgi:hypothetical protein